MKSTLALNLYLLRKHSDKTQKEIEQKLGLGDHRWSNYENGIREPDKDLLKAIADYFNVTIDYLYEEHEDLKDIRESIEKIIATKDINVLLQRSDLWKAHLEKDEAWEPTPIWEKYDQAEDEAYEKYLKASEPDIYDDPQFFFDKEKSLKEELVNGNINVIKDLVNTLADIEDIEDFYESSDGKSDIEAILEKIDNLDEILLYCLIARHHLYTVLDKEYGIK